MPLGAIGGLAGGLFAANALGKAADAARFNPFNINTGVGSVDFSGGALNTSLDPRLQALSDQQLGLAGGLFSQLQGDPSIAAQDLFNQAFALTAPEQARTRASNESRLFAQGRLGSTGGALQTQGVEDAIARQNNALALQSIFDAQNLQDQLLGRATNLQAGALQLENLPLGLLNASIGAGDARAQAGARAGQFAAQRGQLLGGLISGGLGGLGQSGLFG